MWQQAENRLTKTFTFPDFAMGLDFVNKVSKIAARNNHHPDIELSWGKVVVHLSTHSVGKVTDKDKSMAKEIDAI